jgi:hypothetical protein
MKPQPFWPHSARKVEKKPPCGASSQLSIPLNVLLCIWALFESLLVPSSPRGIVPAPPGEARGAKSSRGQKSARTALCGSPFWQLLGYHLITQSVSAKWTQSVDRFLIASNSNSLSQIYASPIVLSVFCNASETHSLNYIMRQLSSGSA